MKCIECGSEMIECTTTYVEDMGDCLVIVRCVPCKKCQECCEVYYTGDVLLKLEEIVKNAKQAMNEITIVHYPAA